MHAIGQRAITIKSSVGDYFPDFAKLAKQKAIEEDCLVAFEFNGMWIYLSASSDLDLAWRDFQRVGIRTDAPNPNPHRSNSMFVIDQRVMSPDGPGTISVIYDSPDAGGTCYVLLTGTSGLKYYRTSELSPEPTTRERIDAVLATLARMQVELQAIQATLTPE